MENISGSTPTGPDFSGDLIMKAENIAEFMFGNRKMRRKVYHLAETSRLPVFKIGAVWCARRSVLLEWIAEQEKRNRKNTGDEEPPKTKQ